MISEHYKQNYSRLVGQLCRKVQRADAEDIVQEAYCNTIEYLSRIDHAVDLNRWLNVVVNNCFLLHIRHERYRGARYDEGSLEEVAVSTIIEKLTADEIVREIDNRPDRNKYILQMRLIEGFSEEETAKLVGVTLNIVKQVVHRFKMEMKDRYNVQ